MQERAGLMFQICLKLRLIRLWIKNILFIIGGIFIMAILSSVLVNDKNSYTRLMMHELEQQQDIDYLLLGASRIYRGLDPEILDDILNACLKPSVSDIKEAYPRKDSKSGRRFLKGH